jgi:glutaminase
MELEMTSRIPLNPFINSGAIVLAGLIVERLSGAAGSGNHIKKTLAAFFAHLMGRSHTSPVVVNKAVYHSESGTADRNRALAYILHNLGTLSSNVEDTLDVYFRMCSVEVTTRDLAIMGATLANAGVNPITGERVVSRHTACVVTGLMSVCGLYNGSGEFAVRVGVPAKSGVSGGIVCAVPGRMGLSVFSPPLDERGNSVAGMAALERLSDALRLRGM